jgi:hypothetical protein
MSRILLILQALTLALGLLAAACSDNNVSATSPATATGNTPAQVEVTITDPPPSWPSERAYHELAYDSESRLVVLVGGCAGDACEPINDAWAFDPVGGQWTELGPPPSHDNSGGSAMTYDSGSDRIVYLQTSTDLDTAVLSTWAYDVNTDTWEDMMPNPNPELGVGARMVYDSESDRVIASGGQYLSESRWDYTAETWAYDYEANTWELLEPDTHPPGTNFHAMAYDSESDRVVISGLTDDLNALLWAYDYNRNTWEELEMDDAIDGWAYGRSVYDLGTDRIILFGGFRFEPAEATHNETWLYDYDANTWESAAANELSGPLSDHNMDYVDAAQVLVFGGGDNPFYGDGLWTYDPQLDVRVEIVG